MRFDVSRLLTKIGQRAAVCGDASCHPHTQKRPNPITAGELEGEHSGVSACTVGQEMIAKHPPVVDRGISGDDKRSGPVCCVPTGARELVGHAGHLRREVQFCISAEKRYRALGGGVGPGHSRRKASTTTGTGMGLRDRSGQSGRPGYCANAG